MILQATIKKVSLRCFFSSPRVVCNRHFATEELPPPLSFFLSFSLGYKTNAIFPRDMKETTQSPRTVELPKFYTLKCSHGPSESISSYRIQACLPLRKIANYG